MRAIDSAFRHAHSVKGMAGAMGFEETATLSHRLEDLLATVRDAPEVLLPTDVDLLLAGVDVLLEHVKSSGAGAQYAPSEGLQARFRERHGVLTGKPVETIRVNETTLRGPSGAAREVSAGESGADTHVTSALASPARSDAGALDSAVRTVAQLASAAPGTVADGPLGIGAAGADRPTAASSGAPLDPGAGGTRRDEHGADFSPVALPGLLALGALGLAEPLGGSGPLAAASASALRIAGLTAAPSAPRLRASAPRLLVKVRVSPQCATPGVRGFLVYKRLSTLGEIFDLKPPLEEVKAGKLVDGVISLELETADGEAKVTQTLKTIVDVELLELRPASEPAPEPEGLRVVGQEPARTVRVRTELLDQFLDAAGELLLATARVREVGKGLPAASRPGLDESVDRLHALVRDLHDKVMKARMTPLSVVTDRLPRASRDIARRRNRDVELKLSGTEIELDRAIVDELSDPLLHLLRNAIDHGIETPEERAAAGKPAKGVVTLMVRRNKDRVVLDVEDDGRGMDPAKLRSAAVERGLYTAEEAARLSNQAALMLCCLPGVSTAADITDISGRGVGMDAVKRAVEVAGGTLEIESTPGRGTRFRLQLPLTVAVVNLLLVGIGDEILGLPINKVLGVVEERPSKLSYSQQHTLLPFAAGLVPVHSLGQLLALPRQAPTADVLRPFVVIDSDDGRVALEVDRLLGQEEVVLKALARPLDLVPGLAGVTILGTGRPVFILDVARLVLLEARG